MAFDRHIETIVQVVESVDLRKIAGHLFNMHVNDNEIYFRILNVYHMKFYLLIVFSLINADNRESTEGLQIF